MLPLTECTSQGRLAEQTSRHPMIAIIESARAGLRAVSISPRTSSPGFPSAIALLGAIESLLSAVVADGMGGARHDANQELIGQGIANIFAPLFGGFAATGAIARTATNIRNGGNSPLSRIFHSLTLLATILALAPLAGYIPLCALAAILFVVACNIREVHHFLRRRALLRADVGILLVTFVLSGFFRPGNRGKRRCCARLSALHAPHGAGGADRQQQREFPRCRG